MAKLHPPEKFSFKPNEWEEWIDEYHRYRRATKLHKEDGETQRDTLIYVMGGKQANQIFKTLKFETGKEVDTDYDTLVKKFTAYFVPKRNLTHERANFHEKSQGKDETVEEFVRELHTRVQHCDYQDHDDQVRDRFVVGLRDTVVKQKLELIDDLTLDKAVTIARQHEQVKIQLAQQEAQHPEVNEARAQARGQHQGQGAKKKWFQKEPDRKPQGQQAQRSQRCDRCGYDSHPQGRRCPASGQVCNKCRKRGHFASVCKGIDGKQTDEVSARPKEYFLGTVNDADVNGAWYEPLHLCGSTVRFKIDTGADVSVMSEATWESLNRPKLKPTTVVLNSPGGRLTCLGEFNATAACKGKEYEFGVVVIEGRKEISLLAREAASKMGLVARIDEVLDQVGRGIGRMKTDPVEIKLTDGATPYCVPTARRVPFPMMDAVETELKRMLDDGVIREVTQPTDWCSPMVPVVKPSGALRICVDLKQLNKAVRREHYNLPSLDDIAPQLQGSTVFSKLDATSGFWQIPLEEESQLLTTFITPFGRYAFRRLPFGISSAPEIFQRKMTELLRNLEGVEVIMDDVLIHGTEDTHDQRLDATLRVLNEAGVQLNERKCEFRKPKLTYFGHLIGKDGIQPDPERVRCLLEMDPPTNVSELRTALGMFQYLGKFAHNLSSVMKPMTDLLKSDVAWTWGPAQESAFKETKKLLSATPTLEYYDHKRPTVVSADASSYGLGAVILQLHGTELKPIAFCSRTLTAAEQQYAQIEKECLAAVWACEKFARYLVGLKEFKLLTDHKPLVPLFNKKDIDKAPIRCQRLLLRMLRFNADMQYVPGKEQVVSDALSRKPAQGSEADDVELSQDVHAFVEAVERGWPVSPGRLQEIRRATEDDQELRAVADFVMTGWPRREDAVPTSLLPYYQIRSELSIADGLLVYRDRIVIPATMRTEMLTRLHESHQHISKTRERANEAIWWPHISTDIKTLVENCDVCLQHRTAQPEQPLRPIALPDRPWAMLGTDLLEFKKQNYLVVVDYYSRWIEVKHLPTTTSAAVITRLKAMFITFGVPDVLVSDNGSQYVSQEFRDFARDWGFSLKTTNPYKPQENGMAERAVRTAKELLKLDDPEVGLLNYRATPHSATGVPPAVALMGRQIQTRLPVLAKKLIPVPPDDESIRKSDQAAKASYKKYYDARHGARELPVLEPGDTVRMKRDQDKIWSKPTEVIATGHDNRSYSVAGPEGGVYRRNRKHLLTSPAQTNGRPPARETMHGPAMSVGVGAPRSPERGAGSPPEPNNSPTAPETPSVGTSNTYRSRVSGRAIRKPLRFRDETT